MANASTRRWRRPGKWIIAGLVVCAVIGVVTWQVFRGTDWQSVLPDPSAREHPDSPNDDSASKAIDVQAEARIVAFCSDCHAMPLAENFPRDRWHREVQRGYEFYARSGRNDLDPPPIHETVAYYRSRAPEQIAFPTPVEAETRWAVKFDVQKLTLDESAGVVPEIAYLRWARLDPKANPLLLLCDMRFGYVAAADLRATKPLPRIFARLGNPCHVEPCDLDGDGLIDLVVADLGSFRPADHSRGRVVWLRRAKAGGPWEEIVLADGLGRVADARPADFDGDGKLDLIVAEFGHYQTGKILLLRNVAAAGQRPRFKPETIDGRPGTIHVPVHDLNGDGLPDFVALVSQEWEHVEAFVNLGKGRFHLQNLWAGPDLNFGSSGIELVDLDRDGDMDVLYTNGDAWDNWYVNPSHGVQWLENLGELKFAYHRLTDLPGAYRALAGDFDGDGDQDVVAVVWLPPMAKPASLMATTPASVICLEQTKPGVFVRHTLETGAPYYATLEVGDFDGDGDPDFAVGPGPLVANALQTRQWLSVWWNQTVPARRPGG
jgi:hypothetical protein